MTKETCIAHDFAIHEMFFRSQPSKEIEKARYSVCLRHKYYIHQLIARIEEGYHANLGGLLNLSGDGISGIGESVRGRLGSTAQGILGRVEEV